MQALDRGQDIHRVTMDYQFEGILHRSQQALRDEMRKTYPFLGDEALEEMLWEAGSVMQKRMQAQ